MDPKQQGSVHNKIMLQNFNKSGQITKSFAMETDLEIQSSIQGGLL